MTDDNVVQMPTALDRLILTLTEDYLLMIASDENWKKSALNFCEHIAQVRAQYPDNIGFDKALDDQGIDADKDTRAAAIKMGRDPKRLKEILDKTERTSLRYIYEYEFRVRHVEKTIEQPKKVTVPTQKALDAIKKLKEQGKKATQKAVAKEAGVSETSVRRAFAITNTAEAVTAAAAQAEPVVNLSDLSLTAQQKMEAYKRRLESGIADRAEEVARARLDEIFKARFYGLEKQVGKIESLLKRRFPFSRIEFKKLLMTVHPDNSASKEMRDEIFRIVNEREVILQPDVETDLKAKVDAARMADLDRIYRDAVKRRAETGLKRGWKKD